MIKLFKDFISNMQKAAFLTDLSLALKEKENTFTRLFNNQETHLKYFFSLSDVFETFD